MKQAKVWSVVLVMLLSLGSAAVVLADEEAGKGNAQVRHLEDGAIEFDSVDPFGNEVTVVIDPKLDNPVNDPRDDPWNKNFRGWERDEDDQARGGFNKARVNLNVYAIADEEYRAAHSNWTSLLNQIIETADNAYIRDFDINWVIQGYYSWTSNGGSASAILSDLASDGSGLPNGLAMGFSDDNNFNAGGIAYVYQSNPGTGFSVCLDQGTSSTTYALRHEIGHNYGASHDFGSVVCMMNYNYSYSVDYFDSAHDSLVNSRRQWFR